MTKVKQVCLVQLVFLESRVDQVKRVSVVVLETKVHRVRWVDPVSPVCEVFPVKLDHKVTKETRVTQALPVILVNKVCPVSKVVLERLAP